MLDASSSPIIGHDGVFYEEFLKNDREQVYKMLAEDKYEFDSQKCYSRLTFAAVTGNVTVIDCLVIDFETNPDECDVEGRTALYAAVWGNQAQAVTRLLHWGANPHAFASHRNWTPLMAAACWGHASIFNILLPRYNHLEDISPITGETTLFCAGLGGNLECVKKVWQGTQSHNLWRKTVSGHYVLDAAIDTAMKTGDFRVVKFVVKVGGNNPEMLGAVRTHCIKRVERKYGRTGIVRLMMHFN